MSGDQATAPSSGVVEAAAIAFHEWNVGGADDPIPWDVLTPAQQRLWKQGAQQVLTAVMPHIEAEVRARLADAA